MDKEILAKAKGIDPKKKTILAIITLLAVIILIVLLAQLLKPERSVASYCKVYKEQSAKLANAQGETYAVAVFSHKSSNPGDFANAFGELEKVAPNDIQPDVKTLRQLFQKIKDDPSQAMSASLSGLSAESSVKSWTNEKCDSI